MSVGLFVRSHNSKTTRSNLTKFLYVLPMTTAWASSDGVAIRYVQRITTGFVDNVMLLYHGATTLGSEEVLATSWTSLGEVNFR